MNNLLDGCRAKLDRARETIAVLENEMQNFLNGTRSDRKIIGRHRGDGLAYEFVASGNPNVPLRFSVLGGEIVHHLRSSLDHLIYALVVRNGQSPTRSSQFPICTTLRAFENECDRGRIKGVSRTAEKLVRSVQPYLFQDPDLKILAVLQRYSNLDKHRLLVVAMTVGQIGQQIRIGNDEQIALASGRAGKSPIISGLSDPTPKKLTESGTVLFEIALAEPAPELFANADFDAQIAFEQCGPIPATFVSTALRELHAGTQWTVEQFANEFALP